MFVFDNITIVHVINFRKERGTVNPMREFKRICQPFSPMSCMRHVHIIYLDSIEKKEAIRKFLETVAPTSDLAEELSAKNAYDFMLKWATGTMSRKLSGNDHFVLGTIREEWTKFLRNKPLLSTCFVPFISAIFLDAKKIRGYADRFMIEELRERHSLLDAPVADTPPDVVVVADITENSADEDEAEPKEADILDSHTKKAHQTVSRKMMTLIDNCVASRRFGAEPEYSILEIPSSREYIEAMVSAHCERIGKTLRSSQTRCVKSGYLKPSAVRIGEKGPDERLSKDELVAISIMNKAIFLMQQRRAITAAASEYTSTLDERSSLSLLAPTLRA